MAEGVRSWGIFFIVGTLSLFFSNIAVGNITVGKRAQLINGKPVFSSLGFILTLLPLYIMVVFTDSGVDYYNYYRIIVAHHSLQDIFGYNRVEPLFNLGSYIVMAVFNNPHIWLFILKSAAILIYFRAFYIVRYNVRFPLAVFAYIAIIYPGSFYIIRQNLASSLVCLAFVQNVFENKKVKPLILLLCAFGFHYTAIPYLAGYLVYLALVSKSANKTRRSIMFVASAFVILLLFLSRIVSGMANLGLNNYTKYFTNQSTHEGSGLLQIIYYLPALYSLIVIFKDTKIRNITLYSAIFIGISFICAQTGYLLPAFIRMRYYSATVFCIIVPFVYQRIKDVYSLGDLNGNVIRNHAKVRALLIILLIYLLIRVYFTYTDLLAIDNDSQLYWYHFTINLL